MVSRVGTLDSVNSAVSLIQMLFLYFRIFEKVIPKVQPSPDAGCSATRWAQEWECTILNSSERESILFQGSTGKSMQLLFNLGS